MGLEDWLSKMYEKHVVIHNKEGYHYGRLCGYGDKFLYLESYQFSKKPVDYFDRLSHSILCRNRNAVLHAEDIISIVEATGVGEDLLQDYKRLRGSDFLTRWYERKQKRRESDKRKIGPEISFDR